MLVGKLPLIPLILVFSFIQDVGQEGMRPVVSLVVIVLSVVIVVVTIFIIR